MRNHSIDTLKFICAFFVIAIHTPQPESIEKYIDPMLRCAVPLFFITSGYFTYGKKELAETIRRRLKDMFKALCWGFALYFICSVAINGRDSLQYINHLLTPKFLLFNSVPCGMHLWYIAAYIYVLATILFIDKFNLYKPFFYLFPILFAANLLMGVYSEILFNISLGTCYTKNFIFTGLPFFATGMLIKRKQIYTQASKQTWILIIACIFFYILGVLEAHIPNLSLGDCYATNIPLSIFSFS